MFANIACSACPPPFAYSETFANIVRLHVTLLVRVCVTNWVRLQYFGVYLSGGHYIHAFPCEETTYYKSTSNSVCPRMYVRVADGLFS